MFGRKATTQDSVPEPMDEAAPTFVPFEGEILYSALKIANVHFESAARKVKNTEYSGRVWLFVTDKRLVFWKMTLSGNRMASETTIPLRTVSMVNKEQYTMTGAVQVEHSAGQVKFIAGSRAPQVVAEISRALVM